MFYVPGPMLGAKAAQPGNRTGKSAGRHVPANDRNYPGVTVVLGGTQGKQRVLGDGVRGLWCVLGVRNGQSQGPLSLKEELTNKVSIAGCK